MLQFDPEKRITAEEALSTFFILIKEHPFFDGITEDNEPLELSKSIFDWGWDNFEPTK